MSDILQRIGVTVLALGLPLGAARPAQATVILTMQELGGDVVVSGAGTVNLAAFTLPPAGGVADAVIRPDFAWVLVGAPDAIDQYFDAAISGPTNFGVGAFFSHASSSTGDLFGMCCGTLVVPDGYVSGAPLSGRSVYAGATFASLGVTPGTSVWTWGSGADADSMTLQIGPAVPEPVSLSLLVVGMTGIAVHRWRRRSPSRPEAAA
jgi:hypothetical protein